jgi:hypothetical protein
MQLQQLGLFLWAQMPVAGKIAHEVSLPFPQVSAPSQHGEDFSIASLPLHGFRFGNPSKEFPAVGADFSGVMGAASFRDYQDVTMITLTEKCPLDFSQGTTLPRSGMPVLCTTTPDHLAESHQHSVAGE